MVAFRSFRTKYKRSPDVNSVFFSFLSSSDDDDDDDTFIKVSNCNSGILPLSGDTKINFKK